MKIRIAGTLVALAAAASSASAGTLNMKYLGNGLGKNARITFGATTLDVFAGQLQHQITGATGDDAYLNGVRSTYCVELTQSVSSAGATYTVVDVALLHNPDLGELKAQALSDIFAGSTALRDSSPFTNEDSMAFQLAIWEIITDFSGLRASLDVQAGGFRAAKYGGGALPAATVRKVNAFLDMIGSESGRDGLVGLTSGSAQDQIALIPAPGTACLAAAGLLALSRRRRA